MLSKNMLMILYKSMRIVIENFHDRIYLACREENRGRIKRRDEIAPD